MKNREHKTYQVEAPNGEKIKVNYEPKFSYSPELNHRVDHFEFYGQTTSDTGYRSEFVFVELDYLPSKDEVLSFVRSKIEELSGLKYGGKVQMALFTS